METLSTSSSTRVQVRAPLIGTVTSLESLQEHLQWAIEKHRPKH